MAEALVCKVCNKKDSSDKCSVCGIAICEDCKHVVQTEDMSASHRVKGMTTEGVLGPSQKKRVVCAKCMAETDFLGRDDHQEDEADKDKVVEIRKDRLKKLRKPKKGSVTHLVGDHKVDLTHLTPDIRGMEELVREILDKNYIETRVKQYDTKIKPYSRVEDISEWDRILLNRYRPLYTQDGNCAKTKKKKKDDVKLALKTLEEHIKGTSKAIAMARTILDEAIKAFGADKKVNLGESILFVAPNTAVLTGFDPHDLAGLNKALEYAEGQLVEAVSVLASGTGDPTDLEQRALHLGSIYIIATEIEEVVKICCFDALSVGHMAVKDYPYYPEVKTPVGMGTIDRSKPVLAFFGDDTLPIIFTVGCLEEEGIIKNIEVAGLGNAGHELVRFYSSGKIITSTTGKAVKGIRAGIPDLIVATNSCFPIDLISEAAKAGIPVLAAGNQSSYPVPDMTDETINKIVKNLSKGKSVYVRSLEKAGEAAAQFFKNFPGKMAKALDSKVVAEAKSKCTECDECFHACPNSLQISPALKGIDGKTPSDLYDSCIYCGKCEEVCPEKIPVIDCIIADSGKKISADNFKMRAGRGPLSHIEFRDLTFGLVLGGNGPGLIALLGCGHNKEANDELADIALELLNRNCAVMTAGCGAAEIASKIDPQNKKFMQDNYLSMATLKGLVNCGGCSGISHIGAALYNLASLGGGIAIQGNFDQPADYSLNRAPFVVIIWGPASERMMAQASGFARAGANVVIGPSGFKYNRSLISNKYDRGQWKMFDGMKGAERETDPCPLHLIYPVETKEEAITMAVKLCIIPCALRDSRLSTIDNYTETYQKYFGTFPDDWSYYLRSPLELPVMKRIKMLKLLQNEGWVIDQKIVAKAKNRDGKMVSMEEYTETYGIKQGQYATLVKRLIMR